MMAWKTAQASKLRWCSFPRINYGVWVVRFMTTPASSRWSCTSWCELKSTLRSVFR